MKYEDVPPDPDTWGVPQIIPGINVVCLGDLVAHLCLAADHPMTHGAALSEVGGSKAWRTDVQCSLPNTRGRP
jgi:hypothetical protein